MLERVQRRATKKIGDISYEMCLKQCGLTTLETRRLRRNLLNGNENIDRNKCSQLRKKEGLEDMELH